MSLNDRTQPAVSDLALGDVILLVVDAKLELGVVISVDSKGIEIDTSGISLIRARREIVKVGANPAPVAL